MGVFVTPAIDDYLAMRGNRGKTFVYHVNLSNYSPPTDSSPEYWWGVVDLSPPRYVDYSFWPNYFSPAGGSNLYPNLITPIIITEKSSQLVGIEAYCARTPAKIRVGIKSVEAVSGNSKLVVTGVSEPLYGRTITCVEPTTTPPTTGQPIATSTSTSTVPSR